MPLVKELAAELPPELPPGVFAHVGDGVRLGVRFGLGAGEAVPAGASWKVLWMLCVIEECTTTRPACISPTISPRSCTRWRTCEVVRADRGRWGETWGGVGRCGEMWGDVGRCAAQVVHALARLGEGVRDEPYTSLYLRISPRHLGEGVRDEHGAAQQVEGLRRELRRAEARGVEDGHLREPAQG